MEFRDWTALFALGVSFLALLLNYFTRRDIKAEKRLIVSAEPIPNGLNRFRLRLRSRSNEGFTAERIRVVWPPRGKIALISSGTTQIPSPKKEDYERSIDPMLSVRHSGAKGDTRMGSGDDHHSVLAFTWDSPIVRWMSSRLPSMVSSANLVLIVSIRSETNARLTRTTKVTIRRPRASKPE